MFTPGFKLFGGMSALGLIGAFIYGLSSRGVGGEVTDADYFGFVDRDAVIGLISLGWKGNVGGASGFMVLIFMSITAAFIGGTVVAFRDADVESVAELGDTPSVMPLGQRPTAPSWWPATTAVGVGVLLIGLVMETTAFWIIGLVLLSAVAIEWALTSWADRSTGDARTNAALRDRVGASLEIPVLGFAVVAVLALAMSRMFLWALGNGAVLVAGILAVVILAVALVAVFMPQLGRRTTTAIVGVVAVAIVGLGVLAAANTEHHGDEHDADHSALSIVESE